MAKSYYAILGIPADASSEEIKSAYRRLAKEYHPDHAGGDSEKFRDIQEAYSVLADSEKRRHYEQHRCGQPVRVRTRPAPVRPAGAEPLIPDREPRYTGRERVGREFVFAGPEEDLFDWILRHFF